MTFTDYAISAVLILLVVPQLRSRRMSAQSLLLPLAIVAAVAFYYLKSVPTAGNDVALDGVLILTGVVLGALAGVFTRVGRNGDGNLYSKAGAAAAILWIVGMAGRATFEFYATHGGSHSVASFSIAHQITGSDAWTAALVLMALTTPPAVPRARASPRSNGWPSNAVQTGRTATGCCFGRSSCSSCCPCCTARRRPGREAPDSWC